MWKPPSVGIKPPVKHTFVLTEDPGFGSQEIYYHEPASESEETP